MTQQTTEPTRTIQLAVMNAVHDLAVIVARDEGYFRDEELDIEFVTAPGMAQVTTESEILNRQVMFDRPLDTMYNDGGLDQYRMCEWGILKRAVEAEDCGLRSRKIVALGAAMSKFAIVVAPDSEFYEPEQLKDKPIALTPNNGSNFTTLKMMEGYLSREHLKTTQAGTMRDRLEAVKQGKVAAACVMEPWISVAQKQGFRILIEAHSSRSEAASDDLDGPTLAAMFRAQTRAVRKFHEDPTPYLGYLTQETGGLLEPDELQTWRLVYAPPQPYTRERFEDTYNWMVSWDMVTAGATYETTVDNSAWEAPAQ
jgi:NitT/TauT family transport system substrate-binding protein